MIYTQQERVLIELIRQLQPYSMTDDEFAAKLAEAEKKVGEES